MSENEKREDVLLQLRALPLIEAKRAWAALLAEHHTEVERLEERVAEVSAENARGLEQFIAAKAEARSARNAALEEAAPFLVKIWDAVRVLDGIPPKATRDAGTRANALASIKAGVDGIRALQSAPVALLDAAKVREAVESWLEVSESAAPLQCRCEDERPQDRPCAKCRLAVLREALGLPLDAEGEGEKEDSRKECTCLGSCRGPERLGEGWKCALGKEKPRCTTYGCAKDADHKGPCDELG